jgi:hypothetical protein
MTLMSPTVLSFTNYVATAEDEVLRRLQAAAQPTPHGARVDVDRLGSMTRIIVSAPWHPSPRERREQTTLDTCRYSMQVLELANA